MIKQKIYFLVENQDQAYNLNIAFALVLKSIVHLNPDINCCNSFDFS